MPEQDAGTGKLQHPEKVLDMIFPAGDESPGVVEPGKEAFDLPATPTASKWPAILGGGAAAVAFMRGDHLDAVTLAQHRIERIAVVPAVPDQSDGEVAKEAGVEGGGDEVRFIRRSAGHVHGERKTMAVADRHDLAPFTTAGRANGSAPFLALAKGTATKASLRSSLSPSRRSS